MDDMSNPKPSKLRRIDDDSESEGDDGVELGPDDLDTWIRLERGRFDPRLRRRLLTSRGIDGRAVLSVVLRYVFGWGTAQYIERRPQDSDDEFETDRWGAFRYSPGGYTEHSVTHCAVHDIGLRLRALEYVSEWLGTDPPAPAGGRGGGDGRALPSLARMCAQRIAMGMYASIVERVDSNFDDMQLYFFEATLPSELRSELSGLPDHLVDEILEEVIVFVIVHLLYVDLRTLPDAPHKENELLLPGRYLSNGPRRASTNRRRRDIQNWWDNRALAVFDRAVPDAGRGSLAKVGIVSHAVRSNFGSLFPPAAATGGESDRLGYCHVGAAVALLFSGGGTGLRVRHPLADGAALVPLALFLLRYLEAGYHRHRDQSVLDKIDGVILPWLKQTGTGTSAESKLDAGDLRLVQSVCLEFLPPFGGCVVIASAIQRCHELWHTNVKRAPGSLVMNLVHEKSRVRMQTSPYRCKHSNRLDHEETAILESDVYAFSSSDEDEFDSEGGVDGSDEEYIGESAEGSGDESSDEYFALHEGFRN